MNPRFQTVRASLTLWYAASLSFCLAALGVLVYSLVRYQLIRHHDREIIKAADAVEQILLQRQDCEPITPLQKAELDRIGDLVLVHEIDGERRVFYRSPDDPARELPVGPAVEATRKEGRFETFFGRNQVLRRYSRPYSARAGRRGLIHVGHRLGDVGAPLASLQLTLLLLAPIAVLASAAGGYWLAGRALRPVDHVTRMAREIEASKLSQRIPVPETPDEIGRLVATLNQMLARLEHSFETMRRFTADASHELRSPLASMRGAIDVALARPREAPEYREALAGLGQDVDRLRSITEELLVLARADAGRITLDRGPVRLDVLAAEVAESFQQRAAERGVRLSSTSVDRVEVLGDERWLRQLLTNLLDNAVKFSGGVSAGEPACVTIDVTSDERRARLQVADAGPGIPEDALERIFERFYRGDDARTWRGAEGFGLGLPIAAWIVTAHGGTIGARNRPEGGSLFLVDLPLASG